MNTNTSELNLEQTKQNIEELKTLLYSKSIRLFEDKVYLDELTKSVIYHKKNLKELTFKESKLEEKTIIQDQTRLINILKDSIEENEKDIEVIVKTSIKMNQRLLQIDYVLNGQNWIYLHQ